MIVCGFKDRYIAVFLRKLAWIAAKKSQRTADTISENERWAKAAALFCSRR